MAKKKKAKKAKKRIKVSRVKKVKRKAKPAKKAKKIVKVIKSKEKVLGKIDHYFDKISVAAIKVLAPFKVGDMLHFKGHTTDFYQRLDSMQIEHQSVAKVKKGDDVGVKVKEFVRDHDVVYLADEKAAAQRPTQPAAQAARPTKPIVQTSIFDKGKTIVQPAIKPITAVKAAPAPQPPQPKPEPKKQDPYSNMRFFNF